MHIVKRKLRDNNRDSISLQIKGEVIEAKMQLLISTGMRWLNYLVLCHHPLRCVTQLGMRWLKHTVRECFVIACTVEVLSDLTTYPQLVLRALVIGADSIGSSSMVDPLYVMAAIYRSLAYNYSRTSVNRPSEKRTTSLQRTQSVLRIEITIVVILKQPPRSGRFWIPDSGQDPRSLPHFTIHNCL